LTCQKYSPLRISNKYLYGDRTHATNVASFSKYPPNDILTIDIGEYKCMIMDPIMVVENIKITKKRKKTYELNRHFQDNYIMKLPCAESMLGFDGRVVQM
jgi:hypothetical protein